MAAPETLTVAAVSNDGKKIRLEGHGETAFGIWDPDNVNPSLAQAAQFKGWVNMEGKSGPYIRVAENRGNGSQAASGGARQALSGQSGPDPQRVSIERQTAAKCAARLLAAQGSIGVREGDTEAKYAERVHFLVDTFFDAIHQEPSAPKSDDDIPF